MSPPLPKRVDLIIWLSAALCPLILIVFVANMHPVPDGDSRFFVPTIKSVASSGVLENKLVNLSYAIDLSGAGRFLYPTPGTPLIIGSLLAMLGKASYPDIFLALSVARALSVLLFAKTVIIVLKDTASRTRPLPLLLASALVVSNGLFLTPSNGRPEILSMLIISSATLASVAIKSTRTRHLLIQLFIGLLLPISIANALVGVVFYLLYSSLEPMGFRRRVYCLGSMILFAVFFFASSYALSNLPLRDGLEGLATTSSRAYSLSRPSNLGHILPYWKTWMLFGIMASLQLLELARNLWRNKDTTGMQKTWFFISILLLCIGVHFFGLRVASSHYQLHAFLPIYQLLALRLVVDPRLPLERYVTRLSKPLLTLAILLSLLDPLRETLLFPYYIYGGSSYQIMKTHYESSSAPCAIAYTTSIAMLDEKQMGSIYKQSTTGGSSLVNE